MKLDDIRPGMKCQVADYRGKCVGTWTVTAIHSELITVRRAGEVRIVNHRRIRPIGEPCK